MTPIPDEIVEAALRVEQWFRDNTVEHWALGGLCSRDMETVVDAYRKELDSQFEMLCSVRAELKSYKDKYDAKSDCDVL